MPDDNGNEMLESDVDQPATRRDLGDLRDATRRDIGDLRRDFGELRQEVRDLRDSTRRDLHETRDELRRHFDVVAESFRADFKNLFDWVEATTSSTGARLDWLETNHGARLLSLESRVTRIEQKPARKRPTE